MYHVNLTCSDSGARCAYYIATWMHFLLFNSTQLLAAMVLYAPYDMLCFYIFSGV